MQASAIYPPCGYTGWPRVYKPYNSTVQMTLYEEWGNVDLKFRPYRCEINKLNTNVTCIR